MSKILRKVRYLRHFLGGDGALYTYMDVCVRQAISIKNITRLSTVVGGGVMGAAAARQAEEEEEEGMQVISL